MIEIRDVYKEFDGTKALNGVTFTVPDGSIYGLVGPNGAGKTTILKHIAGIYRQDSGEIMIGGSPVYENTEIKSKIMFIPDEIYYFPQASIREMAGFYKGIYPGFSMTRYKKLGRIFALDDKAMIRRMSKGMQKQAAFWLAVSACPEILILDEPVDGLDPVMRRQVWSVIMEDVAETGTTVIVSSHNLRELEDVCDRVCILHEGKTLLERDLSELQENMVKVQAVFRDGNGTPEELDVLHETAVGKIKTLIVKGSKDEVSRIMSDADPVFYELIPLTLEEIFIYELGGNDYNVKDILL